MLHIGVVSRYGFSSPRDAKSRKAQADRTKREKEQWVILMSRKTIASHTSAGHAKTKQRKSANLVSID